MTEDDKAKRLGEAVFEAIASLPGYERGFQKDAPTSAAVRIEECTSSGNYQIMGNFTWTGPIQLGRRADD